MSRKPENETEWHEEDRLLYDDIEKAKGDMSSSDPETRKDAERHFENLIPSESSNGYPPCTERIAHRRH